MKPRPSLSISRARVTAAACRARRASDTPQFPAHCVTPCSPSAPCRAREHQPVVVRVRVDEAGRGDLAGGVDLDLAFLLQFPIRKFFLRNPISAAKRARACRRSASHCGSQARIHLIDLAPERRITSAHFGSPPAPAENASGPRRRARRRAAGTPGHPGLQRFSYLRMQISKMTSLERRAARSRRPRNSLS